MKKEQEDRLIKKLDENHSDLKKEILRSRKKNTKEHVDISASAEASERVAERLDKILLGMEAFAKVKGVVQQFVFWGIVIGAFIMFGLPMVNG